MSLIDNGIGNFRQEIESIMKDVEGVFDLKSEQSDNSKEKPSVSIPLSKSERTDFIAFCSLERIPVKEKIAELIKDYIEEKRKQMKK